MKSETLKIENIEELQGGIYSLTLSGDFRNVKAPGQFVNIRIDGFYLRRPMSICRRRDDSLTVIFKAAGEGTKKLAAMKKGGMLEVLCPLGNGFDISKGGSRPLIVGGGTGVPPLYGLAEALKAGGVLPQVVTGFNASSDIILTGEFRALGIEPIITTVDGSAGIRGVVTDAMKDLDYNYVYACGPEPMLKAVYNAAPDGQFSFEARMACGFGACMGCSRMTKYGSKRICKDGPVLYKEEIIW